MSWWLLGIVYYIIGIIVSVREWIKDVDLDLINTPIILISALVWPVIIAEAHGIKFTLIKRRHNDTVRKNN